MIEIIISLLVVGLVSLAIMMEERRREIRHILDILNKEK